jgi:cell shape-determining protein MreC
VAWEGWLAELTQTLVAPIMNSASAFSHAVRPPAVRQASSEEVERLTRENARWSFMFTQVQQENERLRRLIADLQKGVELAPDPSMRLVSATVIGRDTDLSRLILHVRAGSAQGVVAGSVAVVDGVQVLGRVESVGPKVSSVRLIADNASGRVRGLVIADRENLSRSVECDLAPWKGGTLRGRLAAPEVRAGVTPVEVRVGQLVRLSDVTWPRNAQMLELGTVESIDPDPEQPIRKIITVRARFDLSRASEVFLRITGEAEAPPPAGGAR